QFVTPQTGSLAVSAAALQARPRGAEALPATPRMFLSVKDQPVTTDGVFSLDLNVDTSGQQVDTLLAVLEYDPNTLQLVNAAGTAIPLGRMVNAVQPAQPGATSSGLSLVGNNDLASRSPSVSHITYSALNTSGSFPSGISTAGTLYFKVRAAGGSSTVVRLAHDAGNADANTDLIYRGARLNATLASATVCRGGCGPHADVATLEPTNTPTTSPTTTPTPLAVASKSTSAPTSAGAPPALNRS
ncbi:MAG: hypothetical protein QOF51_1727, partial [Chloroflexota bacterium]|nr:hypothetical protein [Chloroflexota bacterium]